MIITNEIRRRIKIFLPKDYRKVIVNRLKARSITVHPNTVSNAWNGSDNEVVVAEILQLANEVKAKRQSLRKRSNSLMKQLQS